MNVAKARCVEVDCKRKRSMLSKFRGGSAEWQILCVPFYLTAETL